MMLFSSVWSGVSAGFDGRVIRHRAPIEPAGVDVALVLDVDHVAGAVDVAEDLQDRCRSIRSCALWRHDALGEAAVDGHRRADGVAD